MINIEEIKTQNEKNDFLNREGFNLQVIKFGAEWCGPCKLMETRLKNLEQDKIGNTLFAEVSIDDDNPDSTEMAESYGITSIPVLLFFKQGEIVCRKVGAISTNEIYDIISKFNN